MPSTEVSPRRLEELAEAVRRAVLDGGAERVRAVVPGRGGWTAPEELQRFLLERACRLELFEPGGARPYRVLPDRAFVEAEQSRGLLGAIRLRLRLSRGPEAGELSHLEQTRLLRRSLRRSGLPLGLTGGRRADFKISFGPALAAGQESEAEYLDVELRRRMEPAEAVRALEPVLPAGFRVIEAVKVPLHFPSVESLAAAARYEVLWAGVGAPPRAPSGSRKPVLREIPGGWELLLQAGVKPEDVVKGWAGQAQVRIKVKRLQLLRESTGGGYTPL